MSALLVVSSTLVVGAFSALLARYMSDGLESVARPLWTRYWVTGLLGMGFGAVAGLTTPGLPEWPVMLVAALASSLLFAADNAAHELPHRVLWPAVLLLLITMAGQSLLMGRLDHLAQAVLIGVCCLLGYFVIAWVGAGQFGLGDVSLSLLLGLLLGWYGGPMLALMGMMGAFGLYGVVTMLLLLGRLVTRKTEMPFGPWMLASAWIGCLAVWWVR